MQAKFGRRGSVSLLGIGGAATAIMVAALLVPQRGVTAPAKAVPQAIVLANLPGDAHAVLNLHTVGCFTETTYRFDYVPTPTPRVTVSQPDATRKAAQLIGTVTLSPEQVRRLDSTLHFFRKYDENGGCTTRDDMDITVYRVGKAVATESHSERTCRRSVLADANPADLKALYQYQRAKHYVTNAVPLLSLSRVVAQAYHAKTQALESIPYLDMAREETEAYKTLQTERHTLETQRRAEQLVSALPGYAEVSRQFRIERVGIGATYTFPYSFYSSLVATTPRLIDRAQWANSLVDEKPLYTWTDFLLAQEAVEKVVTPHRWIQQWKATGPVRSVESTIVGVTMLTERTPEQFVYPAWKHAGFQGLPRYEVLLRRGNVGTITVYFGDQETRALILRAEPYTLVRQPGQSVFWLDKLKLFYHPSKAIPEYVTVTPEGVWEQNTRVDTVTPTWFRNLR